MKNKTISFETAEAAVMQTWKSLLKQTNPYLVPILLPMIEHFKPLFQEFYDLGVSHGKTAQVQEKDAIIQKLSDQLYKQEMKTSAARVLCETACELLDGYTHQDAMVILDDLEQAMKEPAND